MVNDVKIRCFLYVAETLSFTEAAKQLYMTQQGVSKHILRIEEELGCPLFVRNRQSVSLTREGRRLYEIFAPFFQEYEAFVRQLRTDAPDCWQVLRAGYQNWLDFGDVPGLALTALKKEIPNADLSVERYAPGPLCQQFLDGKLDLVVMLKRFAPKSAEFNMLLLCETPMVVLASRAHPLASPGATYKDFFNETFIIDAFPNESPTDTVLRARHEYQAYGLTPGKIIVAPNRDSVYAAVELGQGVMVGSSMVRSLGRNMLLSYPTDASEPLVCAWRSNQPQSTAECYAKLLQQHFSRGL